MTNNQFEIKDMTNEERYDLRLNDIINELQELQKSGERQPIAIFRESNGGVESDYIGFNAQAAFTAVRMLKESIATGGQE